MMVKTIKFVMYIQSHCSTLKNDMLQVSEAGRNLIFGMLLNEPNTICVYVR